MALNIKINGSNYVSEKRKTTFEKALKELPVIQQSAPEPVSEQTEASSAPVPAETPVIVDYSAMLSSLEKGLSMSFDHQEDTLRVHEQYLHNQAEYAEIFSQLMEQQSQLFSQGASAPTEALTTVLQTLSRSIEQFHAHQGDTLNVHNSFLQQQADYSREFVSLLRQQYSNIAGQETSQAQSSGTPAAQISSPAPAPKKRRSLPNVQPAQVVKAEPQTVVQAPKVEKQNPPVDAAEAVDLDALTSSLLEIVAEKTGYPADMLELEMDMEADLGIDSIKRVEILGALQDAYPSLPEIDNDALTELRTLAQIIAYMEGAVASTPPPVVAVSSDTIPDTPAEPTMKVSETVAQSSDNLDTEQLQTALLDIVSEKTGYPADMLEMDMDMEADLGIDSIKRVEILGAMQDAFPALPELGADELAELRTLGQIKEALNSPVPVALKKA